MTELEQEVIEAATAWRDGAGPTKETHNRLFLAINALPKPYESLVSRQELESICFGDDCVEHMREAIVLALRRMSKRLADTGYVAAADAVEGTADEEGEYNQ